MKLKDDISVIVKGELITAETLNKPALSLAAAVDEKLVLIEERIDTDISDILTPKNKTKIKELYESNEDTNVFKDSDVIKLESTEIFTADEKSKLNLIESPSFKGYFESLEALTLKFPVGEVGDAADIDDGLDGFNRYIWSSSEETWVKVLGESTLLTPTQIKTSYESLPDTNAFKDADLTKLNSIATGATKNSTDTVLLDRANHTGTQEIDTINGLNDQLNSKVDKVEGKELSSNDFTDLDSSKLASISTGATKNASDTVLLDRANHTGTQEIDTISGLRLELDDLASMGGSGGSGGSLSPEQLGKLNGISIGATKNSTDTVLLDRTNHTGTQEIDTINGLNDQLNSKVNRELGKSLSSNDFTDVKLDKLTNIEDLATKNSPDEVLLDRANHTGTQEIDTISGLEPILTSSSNSIDSISSELQEINTAISENTSDVVKIYDAMEAGVLVTGFVDTHIGLISALGNKLTFTPNSEVVEVYRYGKKYIIDNPVSMDINIQNGGGYVCYDVDTSEMRFLGNEYPDYSKDIFLAWVYLNDGNIVWVGRETHGSARNTEWHKAQHINLGTVWRNGGAVEVNDDLSITLATPITIADEDLVHSIVHSDAEILGEYEQKLVNAYIINWYSKNNVWMPLETQDPLQSGITNLYADGVSDPKVAEEGSWLTQYITFTDDLYAPVKVFMSPSQYETREEAIDTELSYADLPMPEMVPAYKVITQVVDGKSVVDIVLKITSRLSGLQEQGGTVGSHDALLGRELENSHPMSAISGLVDELKKFTKKDANLTDVLDIEEVKNTLSLKEAAFRDVGTTSDTVASGVHEHTPSQVGLSNVDNTSDADKPMSTAAKQAAQLKFNKSDVLQQTGTSKSQVMSQDSSTKSFFSYGQGLSKSGKIHVSTTEPVGAEEGDIWLKI